MNFVKYGAAVAKPSDDKEKRESDHEDRDNLTPKTARELVLGLDLFGGTTFGV